MTNGPQATTTVADLGGGKWRVEIGMSDRPYRVVFGYAEQAKDDDVVELVCDAFTVEGGVVRASWVRAMADDFDEWDDHARAAVTALRGDRGGVLRRPVRRKRELTDDFLRDVVRRHGEFAAKGRPPTATLAAEEGVSTAAVKGWLRRARERGIEGAS